jgi:hypothetical protein
LGFHGFPTVCWVFFHGTSIFPGFFPWFSRGISPAVKHRLHQQPAHQPLAKAGPTAAQQQIVEIPITTVPGKQWDLYKVMPYHL